MRNDLDIVVGKTQVQTISRVSSAGFFVGSKKSTRTNCLLLDLVKYELSLVFHLHVSLLGQGKSQGVFCLASLSLLIHTEFHVPNATHVRE